VPFFRSCSNTLLVSSRAFLSACEWPSCMLPASLSCPRSVIKVPWATNAAETLPTSRGLEIWHTNGFLLVENHKSADDCYWQDSR
jgi:hypothetical protein